MCARMISSYYCKLSLCSTDAKKNEGLSTAAAVKQMRWLSLLGMLALLEGWWWVAVIGYIKIFRATAAFPGKTDAFTLALIKKFPINKNGDYSRGNYSNLFWVSKILLLTNVTHLGNLLKNEKIQTS